MGSAPQGPFQLSAVETNDLSAQNFPAQDTSSTGQCDLSAAFATSGSDISYSHVHADKTLQKIEAVLTAIDWLIKQKATIDLMTTLTGLPAAADSAAAAGARLLQGEANVAAKSLTELFQELKAAEAAGDTARVQQIRAQLDAIKNQELQAFKGEFDDPKAGELIKLMIHNQAGLNKDALGLSRTDYQSMHLFPQSAGASIPGYNAGKAFTVLGDRVTIHTPMDAFWKSMFTAMTNNGITQISAQAFYQVIETSIEVTPTLTAAEKLSLQARLFDEMFRDMGLKPGDMLKIRR
jgi:hypothetical protein